VGGKGITTVGQCCLGKGSLSKWLLNELLRRSLDEKLGGEAARAISSTLLMEYISLGGKIYDNTSTNLENED
jgi:hypothetical protein